MRKTNAEMPDLLSKMGYEARDVSLQGIFIGIAALFVFILIAMVGSVILYNIFIPDWYKGTTRIPIPAARRLPPHPQLQTEPRRDMVLYREAEDEMVAGRADDGHGHRAKMSVNDAINMMATQRGIAGVRGDASPVSGGSYPGGTGLKGTSPAAVAPVGTHDMGNAGSVAPTSQNGSAHGNGAH